MVSEDVRKHKLNVYVLEGATGNREHSRGEVCWGSTERERRCGIKKWLWEKVVEGELERQRWIEHGPSGVKTGRAAAHGDAEVHLQKKRSQSGHASLGGEPQQHSVTKRHAMKM